jgi:hypothetical protein
LRTWKFDGVSPPSNEPKTPEIQSGSLTTAKKAREKPYALFLLFGLEVTEHELQPFSVHWSELTTVGPSVPSRKPGTMGRHRIYWSCAPVLQPFLKHG